MSIESKTTKTTKTKTCTVFAALARIDAIIDAPDGTPEADERATLGTLVSVYEEEYHPYPTLTGTALLVRCMEAQDLNQSQVPEIGRQPLVSAVLNGKRTISPPDGNRARSAFPRPS